MNVKLYFIICIMEIKFELLTKENYDDVLKIKHQLFPESNSDKDYEDYFNNLVLAKYFLITAGGGRIDLAE